MTDAPGSEPVYCSEQIVVLKSSSLTEAGWEQRTVSDSRRIGELEEQYVELGFETRVTGLDPDSFGDACNVCAETACSTYQALFTRRPNRSQATTD